MALAKAVRYADCIVRFPFDSSGSYRSTQSDLRRFFVFVDVLERRFVYSVPITSPYFSLETTLQSRPIISTRPLLVIVEVCHLKTKILNN
jgi:hypothetical protein